MRAENIFMETDELFELANHDAIIANKIAEIDLDDYVVSQNMSQSNEYGVKLSIQSML